MNLRRYRDFAIVLLALAVPFWFLRASMREDDVLRWEDLTT